MNGRHRRTTSGKLREASVDPVIDPTASEMEVAQTLLKMTLREGRRKLRAHQNFLRIQRPDGVPPLYGTFKEVEAARKLNSSTPKAFHDSSTSLNFETRVSDVLGRTGWIGMGGGNPSTPMHRDLTISAESSLPHSPHTSLWHPSEEPRLAGPFHQDLNNLHASAAKLTESVRQGQVPPDFLARLIVSVPPIVFKPEFHQEIEHVRTERNRRNMISSPVPLYKDQHSPT